MNRRENDVLASFVGSGEGVKFTRQTRLNSFLGTFWGRVMATNSFFWVPFGFGDL
jgi:hypothetical protein